MLLEKSGLEVIHQTGDKDLVATRQRYTADAGELEARAVPAEALGGDGLGGPRASAAPGAMTVAELAAAGRPSILVPFGAAAGGHQI